MKGWNLILALITLSFAGISDASNSLTRMKELVKRIETLRAHAPMQRAEGIGANLLGYEGVIAKAARKPKLLGRDFIEASECGGDSLFTEYFDNGMVSEAGRTALHFVGKFETGVNGIQAGMTRENLRKALGKEYWGSDRIATYACPDPVEREHGNPQAEFECGWFYFENGQLIGLTYYIKSDC